MKKSFHMFSYAWAPLTLCLWALLCGSPSRTRGVASFSFRPPSAATHGPRAASSRRAALPTAAAADGRALPPAPSQEQALAEFLPATHPLRPLLAATAAACAPKPVAAAAGSSRPTEFRYEWGTWADADRLAAVETALGEVRLLAGADAELLRDGEEATPGKDRGEGGTAGGKRVRVASGKYWDAILHVLPKGARYTGKWPEGSWDLLQPLTGLVEIAQLRGPDRDGIYSRIRPRDLRGGGDGSGFLGSGADEDAAGHSTGGEAAVKVLGGPLRSYTGKATLSTLLEIVVRPPIEVNVEAAGDVDDLEWESVASVLTRVVAPAKEEEEEEGEEEEEEEAHVAASGAAPGLNAIIGMDFSNVGGLDRQLDDIARRVLASRANPKAARRLGVSHVRGILLSGPPGCGKTLLARELARLLGARAPQVVNGPEILDKFIGEAERRVRELFLPAEREYDEVGDASALHIIILDEMDAIARKRGSMTSDTTGVRDSVVNQLLAKMDGVKAASNVLVVGLTNRPELLDPALLRPGRLEVQLRIEPPDRRGRKDILAIHTRGMREERALSNSATALLDDLGDDGMGARTEHFSGAELAGLIRSAASFALARAVESGFDEGDDSNGMVLSEDLELALKEVRPALGTDDEVLKLRYPMGISECSSSMKRVLRDLHRFTSPVVSATPRLHSLLLVGGGGATAAGGAGVTALASHAASESSMNGYSDYVRFITALDILTSEGGGGDEARAAALVERFSEAREMSHSLLVLDDVDQILSGTGPGGYSSIMLSTLRALIRTPPPSVNIAKAGGQSKSDTGGKTLHIIATTSRSDAACNTLHEIFEETIVVPLLSESESVEKLLHDSLPGQDVDAKALADTIINGLPGKVGCKTALRLAERAISTAVMEPQTPLDDMQSAQLSALQNIIEDLAEDAALTSQECQIC